MENYQFHNAQSLLGIANRPELQADEKPLFTRDESGNDPLTAPPGELDGLGHDHEDGSAFALEQMDGFKAVYNPETGTLFDVVTDSYDIVNPGAFIGPLVSELVDRDQAVSGRVNVYNDGAKGYAELLFDNQGEIYLPGRGRSDPVKVGFDLRWSHDSGLSVRVNGYAQDTACSNSIRQVTSPINVKHSGDVADRIDWDEEWATALDELGAFSDDLARIIDDAMEHDLIVLGRDMDQSFSPSTWREVTDPLDTIEGVKAPGPVDSDHVRMMAAYYELLGLPRYLATSAADRLMWRLAQRDDPRIVTAWDAYSAATYALTHHFRGDAGKSDDDMFRTAKDILMNPDLTIGLAAEEAHSRRAPADGDEAAPTFEDDGSVEETAGDALRTHSERERTLEAFGDQA